MGRSTRPPTTFTGRMKAAAGSAVFVLVVSLYGLVMAVPLAIGYGLYRLLDGILDERRPLAAAVAVPFAHAVWAASILAFWILTRHPLPPYAATEVGLMAGVPFLLLFFPAILPAVVMVAFQGLCVRFHIDDLLDPATMTEQLEVYGFTPDADGLRRAQVSLFAQIGFRVVSIAAILGCLFAYYWPGVPRPLRRFEHDVLDLTPGGGGGYLSPWVRDADGHYRRG